MVTVGTRIDGNNGVMEDSEELVAALDAKVKSYQTRMAASRRRSHGPGWKDEPGDGQIAAIKGQVFAPF